MTVGERIRSRRKELNMTQKQLAGYANVSQQMIAQLENSSRIPRQNTLTKIANALQTSEEWLLNTDSRTSTPYKFSSEENFKIIHEAITTLLAKTPDAKPLPDDSEILMKYQKLNRAGKQKVIDYISDLLKIDDYIMKD